MLYFAGYLLGVLVVWFVLWGQILDRLISKAGFSGKVYRWFMGLSAASIIPVAVVVAVSVVFSPEDRPNEGLNLLGGMLLMLHVGINWLILMVLAWWPWPSLRK